MGTGLRGYELQLLLHVVLARCAGPGTGWSRCGTGGIRKEFFYFVFFSYISLFYINSKASEVLRSRFDPEQRMSTSSSNKYLSWILYFYRECFIHEFKTRNKRKAEKKNKNLQNRFDWSVYKTLQWEIWKKEMFIAFTEFNRYKAS